MQEYGEDTGGLPGAAQGQQIRGVPLSHPVLVTLATGKEPSVKGVSLPQCHGTGAQQARSIGTEGKSMQQKAGICMRQGGGVGRGGGIGGRG